METDLRTISESAAKSSPAIEATYKSREVEGIVDLLFYRRIGFRVAQFCAGLNLTPTAVTIIGGVFGVVAGHFYFYRDVAINLIGMALHIVANIFDNADGQLARLTNQQSRTGRILDPIIDHIVWLSIYVHLALRLQRAGSSGAIWLLALAAGISHGLQAVAADYWRNAYLYFGKGRSDLDDASTIKEEYQRYTWRSAAWLKMLVWLQFTWTREQEFLLGAAKKLHARLENMFADTFPGWFRSRYAAAVLPTFKWWSLLMTNTRMLILFLLFLVRQPVWFFWLELVVGNLLLVYLIQRQQKICRALLQILATQAESA